MNSIVKLKEEGRNGAVEVIFEGPVVGEPVKRVVGRVKLGKQHTGVGVKKERRVLSMQNQDRKARE